MEKLFRKHFAQQLPHFSPLLSAPRASPNLLPHFFPPSFSQHARRRHMGLGPKGVSTEKEVQSTGMTICNCKEATFILFFPSPFFSILLFFFIGVGHCLYIAYKYGCIARGTELRQRPWLFQDLSTTLQYRDHISSRGSLLADGGEHSATTAKSLTTFRHGSPNTSLVTLIAHLFLPSQAWEYSKLSINTGLECGGFSNEISLLNCVSWTYIGLTHVQR